MKLKIVVLCGEAQRYIKHCLDSYLAQAYKDWEMVVMVDPMGDLTYERSKEYQSNKIKVVKNEKRRFALGNTVKGIELLNPSDDVIITMDGDDWLLNQNSLDVVVNTYRSQSQLLLTHGSWVAWPNPNVPDNNEAYTEEEFKNNIRKSRWKASQLRTFKYRLWKNINDEDLRDHEGNYFSAAGDCAYMWPMMEMAGYNRVKFIPNIIYVYNQSNPNGDSIVNVYRQMFFTDYIAAKPSYDYRENI